MRKLIFIMLSVFMLSAQAENVVENTVVNDSVNLNEVTVTSLYRNNVNVGYLINNQTLISENYGQEPSHLFASMPNIFSMNDNGTEFGYGYFRIRGLDQTRINVTLDGMPWNESEDYGTYFANSPDLMSSMHSIKVERGTNSMNNGTASSGGSINIESVDLLNDTTSYAYVGGGSLLDNLKRYISIYRRAFPEDIVQHFMKQILDALNYLHFNRIIHRDLKLDNILLSYPSEYDKQSLNLKSAKVKLIDFGFATILPVNKDVTFTALGTPPNMDPKILEQFNTGVKNPGYNEKIDIWSLGTLCYEMVVGHSPFVASNIKELYQKVKQGNYTIPSSLSEEIVSFIDEMLQQDTNERADTNKLLNHKFLVNPVNTFHPSNIRSLKATFLPGGLINMKSKKTKQQYNYNNNMNIWEIFNQPEFYTVQTNQYTNQIPVQVQVQPQIQHQPKIQVQVQPQIQHQPQQQPYNPYGVQQYQTNAYYNNQAQNNYEYYYSNL